MPSPSPLEFHPPAETEMRLREPRMLTLLLVGRITGALSDTLCRIRNISSGGLMAEVSGRFAVGEAIRVELRNGQGVAGQVRWVKDGQLGVQFSEPVRDLRRLIAEPRSERKAGVRMVRAPRMPAQCRVALQIDGRHVAGVVTNLSQSGARIVTTGPLERDRLLTLSIAGLPPLRGAVRWTDAEGGGIVFLEPLAFATLAPWLDDPALRYNARG